MNPDRHFSWKIQPSSGEIRRKEFLELSFLDRTLNWKFKGHVAGLLRAN